MLALIFATFLMLLLSGCSNNPAPDKNSDLHKNEETQKEVEVSSSPDEEVCQEKSIHIVTYDFHNTLYPWQMAQSEWMWPDVYEGLLCMDPNKAEIIKGELCSEWNHSEDWLTWTFTIKPEIYFTDGTVCDAYAIEEYFSLVSLQNFSYCGIEEISASDEHTLTVKLSEVCAWIERELCQGNFAVSSPTALKLYGKDDARSCVGTGPYMLSTQKSTHLERTAEFIKNENYRDKEAAAFDKIIFSAVSEDFADPAEGLLAGKCDVAVFSADAESLERYSQEGIIIERKFKGTDSIWFNPSLYKPFEDKSVRKAICCLIDTEAINQQIYCGMGNIQTGIWAEGSLSYVPFEGCGYDSEEGLALLADAGLSPEDISFVIRDNGDKTKLNELIKEQLNSFGMNIEIAYRSPEWPYYYVNGSPLTVPGKMGYYYGEARFGIFAGSGLQVPWTGIMQAYNGEDLTGIAMDFSSPMWKFSWQEIYAPDLYAQMCDLYDRMMSTAHWDEMVECARELTRIVQEDYAALPLVQEPVFFAVREGAGELFETFTQTSMFKWMYQ